MRAILVKKLVENQGDIDKIMTSIGEKISDNQQYIESPLTGENTSLKKVISRAQ